MVPLRDRLHCRPTPSRVVSIVLLLSLSTASAQLVSEGPGGLVYQTYANEGQTHSVNTVPDYSRAGYQGGGVAIPFVPAVTTLSPSGGDDTFAIQTAINAASGQPLGTDGFRGAVYLSPGDYTVSTTLNINASGVVIRGAGQQETGGTRITYTATTQSNLFHFHGGSGPSYVGGTARDITDAYVPVGAKTLNVTDATPFALGDLIRITNLMNQDWIDDIGMTEAGGLAGGSSDPAWEPGNFNLKHFRYITAINGNELTLDAPIVQVIEDQYGSGDVRLFNYNGAIKNVGIEAIRLESTYTSDNDEDHGWVAIEMRHVVNGWVRQVTSRYFGMGTVLIEDDSQFITVQDSASLDPKSQTTGGRKYSFSIDDSSYALFQRCLTRGGRHDYVSGSLTPGPNVFVDSLALEAKSDIGPHFRYATGELYDNLSSNNSINVQNRLNYGTSHGWSGAQVMFWNVEAGGIICDAPTGAMNWSVGAVGTKKQGEAVSSEPYGIWESENVPVIPRSLYYAQLEERLGTEALNAVVLPQQKLGTLWSELESWEGDGLFLDAVVCWADTSTAPVINAAVDIVARIRDLDMLANLSTVTWSQLSGPGTASFGDPSLLETTASFTLSGQYALQLLADSGSRQISGTLVVNVQDPNDNTAPAVPSGLAATPAFNNVSLNWDDNVETDLAGYVIYRSESSQSYGLPLVTGLGDSEYVDASATNGTQYFYVVRAADVNGNVSADSSEIAATPFDNNPPPFVSFIAPTDGTSVVVGSDVAVEVEALDPDGNVLNVELFLDGQLIRQEISAPYTWGEAGQSDMLLEDMALGSYELEAVALDDGGFTTRVSITLNVVADLIAPAPPIGLSPQQGNGVIGLDWSNNGEIDLAIYSVYRSTTSGDYGSALVTGLVSSGFKDTSVANGTTYFYTVTATDISGNESAQSAEVSIRPSALIDFGTDPTSKVTVEVAGFTAVVPAASSATHVADAYRIATDLDSGMRNFAFLSDFVEMGGASRSDFSMIMEARLVSAGAGSNNNYRYGVTLFSDGVDLEGSGIQAQLLYDDGTLVMEISEGLNGSSLASQTFKMVAGSSRPYEYPEGESYTFEVNGTYNGDSLDLAFTLSDGSLTKTLNHTLDAALYPGTLFGGGARIRNGFTVDFDRFSISTEGVNAAPNPPDGLQAAPGNALVSLEWDGNFEADLASYSVYKSTTSGAYGSALATGLLSADFTDSTPLNGTTYFYVVTAMDNDGNESEASEEVSATPSSTLNVAIAATDSSCARSNNEIQDVSESIFIKRNDWTGPNVRIAYIRFPLFGNNRLGGIAAEDIDSAALEIFVINNQASDSLRLYALKDGTQASGAALSESSWSGGAEGTAAGGNNLQGSKRPDGEQPLPNANTSVLLGNITFAAGVDTGSKQIVISDLAAFRELIANDTNGEITLLLRGSMDSDVNQIASVFNSSGHPVPTLTATGDALDIAPSTPIELAATPGDASVSLNWDDNIAGDLDSYTVYRSSTSGTDFSELSSVVATSDYVDHSAANGYTYYYVVTAVDSGGNESAQSAEASAVLPGDNDGDGIDDNWERANFGSTAAKDGSLDSDGDGTTDFFEYLYGSDPEDAGSRGFRLFAGPDPVSGVVTFEWDAGESFILGTDYSVSISTNLSSWDPLPVEHYSIDDSISNGIRSLQLQITHDYGTKAFIKLERPNMPPVD
jgi:fibronectin type 3 domain-containing protein